MSAENQLDKYQPYPEYKNSGINHIGLIPKDWCTSRIGFVTQCLDSKREPLNAEQRGEIQGEYPYWGANGIVDYISKWLFNEPLVLIGEDGAPFFDLNKDVAFNVSGKLWVNNHAHIIRPWPHKVDGVFLKYVLNVVDFHLYINGSTRDKLTQEALNSIVFRYPSQEEQRTIAAFLDYETARIDQLIAKQQQLIELLKEKRQAVISHAVTKGLNPNAPMKDSGVEWLGQVPEHWRLVKLKWLAKTTSGSTPNTAEQEKYYNEGQYPWVRTTDLNNGTLTETPIWITEQAIRDTACSILPIGSVLIAMYGGAGSIGKHALLHIPATTNQAVCAILPMDCIVSEYLNIFADFQRPFWMVGAEGTRKDPNIGQDHIRDMLLPLPPKQEQMDIYASLEKHEALFEAAERSAVSMIELLQERRTALISAAVTGKIDLRGWQPPKREVVA